MKERESEREREAPGVVFSDACTERNKEIEMQAIGCTECNKEIELQVKGASKVVVKLASNFKASSQATWLVKLVN